MEIIQNQDIHINMQDQKDPSLFEMSTVDIATDEFQVNARNKLRIGIDGHTTGQIDLPIVNSSCDDILSEEGILSKISDTHLSPKLNKIEYRKMNLNETKVESSDEDFSESLQNAAQTVRAAARWLAEKYLEFPKWILAPLEKPTLYEYKPLEVTPIKPVKGFTSASQYGRRKPSIVDKTAAQQQIHSQLNNPNQGPRSVTVSMNGQPSESWQVENRIADHSLFVKKSARARESEPTARALDNLEKQLRKGGDGGIKKKPVKGCKGVWEGRARGGARLFYRQNGENSYEKLAETNHSRDQKAVISKLQELFPKSKSSKSSF